MASKKSSAAPAAEAVPSEPAGPTDPREKMTKREMVRNAVLAGKTKPQHGVQWIKDEYGVELTTATFSVTKSQLQQAGEAPAQPKKRGRKPKATATPSAPPAAANHAMTHAEAARAVKDLVEKLGAAEVKNLADLFGD